MDGRRIYGHSRKLSNSKGIVCTTGMRFVSSEHKSLGSRKKRILHERTSIGFPTYVLLQKMRQKKKGKRQKKDGIEISFMFLLRKVRKQCNDTFIYILKGRHVSCHTTIIRQSLSHRRKKNCEHQFLKYNYRTIYYI